MSPERPLVATPPQCDKWIWAGPGDDQQCPEDAVASCEVEETMMHFCGAHSEEDYIPLQLAPPLEEYRLRLMAIVRAASTVTELAELTEEFAAELRRRHGAAR